MLKKGIGSFLYKNQFVNKFNLKSIKGRISETFMIKGIYVE